MTSKTADPRGGAVLYTPELLALAVSLGKAPLDPSMPHTGEARSRTCGSTVRVSLATDDGGLVSAVGLQASACAVGQAAAALCAQGLAGRDRAAVSAARAELAAWLAGASEHPDWPGLAALDAARDYPARHGAILLAWDAALAALSKDEPHR